MDISKLHNLDLEANQLTKLCVDLINVKRVSLKDILYSTKMDQIVQKVVVLEMFSMMDGFYGFYLSRLQKRKIIIIDSKIIVQTGVASTKSTAGSTGLTE